MLKLRYVVLLLGAIGSASCTGLYLYETSSAGGNRAPESKDECAGQTAECEPAP